MRSSDAAIAPQKEYSELAHAVCSILGLVDVWSVTK